MITTPFVLAFLAVNLSIATVYHLIPRGIDDLRKRLVDLPPNLDETLAGFARFVRSCGNSHIGMASMAAFALVWVDWAVVVLIMGHTAVVSWRFYVKFKRGLVDKINPSEWHSLRDRLVDVVKRLDRVK